MSKIIIILAAFFGALAVLLGAFGAHILANYLNVRELHSYEVAIRYQFFHTLLLLYIGILKILSEKQKALISFVLILGMILFSGSIYLISTRALTSIDFSFLWWLTPFGGILLIIAWLLLAQCTFSSKKNS